jgi:hypothetical protein
MCGGLGQIRFGILLAEKTDLDPVTREVADEKTLRAREGRLGRFSVEGREQSRPA